jgi:predicted RNA-binding Zn ribbon-like protein
VITASFAVLLPGEPVPVRLMNTVWADRQGVHDALTTPAELHAWLADVFPDDPASGADLDRFRLLRDALRRLAALLTADSRPAATNTTAERAVADVNEAAALAPTCPQLILRGGRLGHAVAGAASPGDHLLTAIAREAIELFAGDGRAEIRACYAPGCVLYFVQDHPRREWCSTACGNRVRAARHYERHHPKASTAER